jgi:hypothetical protein
LRNLAVIPFLFACLASSLSQVVFPSPKAAVPPKRDATAIAVISGLSSSNGWHKANLPADVVITGTVIRYMGDTTPSADFTIKLRGADQYRYEEGGFVATTNGAAGVISRPDGKKVRISAQSAVSMRGMIFPALTSLADWDDPNVEVASLGAKHIKDQDSVGVHVERHFADDDSNGKLKQLAAPLDIWLSSSDGSVVRIDYARVGDRNHYVRLKESVYYSDFRNVRGISVPFKQDIYIDGEHIKTMQFNSVTFNNGLSDIDFDIKADQGGAK